MATVTASTAEFDYPYEASDEASESELMDRSLSVWRGWRVENEPDFLPVPLDLHTASSIGQYDCVRNIIAKGEMDLDRKNMGGWTPIMYAAYIGHDNIVNLLLDARVRVNVKNNKGQTPLMLAASCGNESVAYFILHAEAELESRDKKGWTALFHATYSGHQNMVTFLLQHGADAHAIEPSRELTPFMMAAAAGHEIIVQCFLQHGVNAAAKALSGDTARSLALINGHTKIVSLIDNHLMTPAHSLRDSGLNFEGDLSSSDENYQNPRRRSNRTRFNKGGLNIKDGPEAFAKILKAKKAPPTKNFVPHGYMTFADDQDDEPKQNYRDVTSPIGSADEISSSNLDSSGGKESNNDIEEDTTAFSKTGALTIKSSSSSSGGLIAALGLSRENSVDGSETGLSMDQRSVCSDPGTGPFSQSWSTGQKPSKHAWPSSSSSPHASTTSSAHTPEQQQGLDILRGAEQLQTLEQIQAAQNRHEEELTRQRIADAFNLNMPPPPPSTPTMPPIPQQPATTLHHLQQQQHQRQQQQQQQQQQQHLQQPPQQQQQLHQKVPSAPMNTPARPAQVVSAHEYDGEQVVRQVPEVAAIQPQPHKPHTALKESHKQTEQAYPDDLGSLLAELGLTKYIPVFEEQEVNLQVFLSLTDNDLKEVGIKLFGPRRKMTNAIARWHSQARCAGQNQEQAYADKLEAEMQELAIQLHQMSEKHDSVAQQLAQEQELRTVTEGYLLEDRVAWQHVQQIAADTRHRCGQIQARMRDIGQYQDELARRFGAESPFSRSGSHNKDSLATALRERLQLEERESNIPVEITKMPTQQIVRKIQKMYDELTQMVVVVTGNADRLLGQDVEYGAGQGEAGYT